MLCFLLRSINYTQNSKFIVTDESNYSYEETINKIKENADKLGWKIPIVHNLHESVAKAGFEVLPVTVIEVCNPKLAGEVLSMEESRFISPMMPIRISVYLTEKGKVLVSRMNSEMMEQIENEYVKKTILESCSSAEAILKGVIGGLDF